MGPSDIMAKVYLWAHPVMSTIYAQWADVGFAEIFGKLSHRFYRPLRQRVRHGLVKGARASDAKGIILYYTLISVYLIIFSI
jgi:hypothetical protein